MAGGSGGLYTWNQQQCIHKGDVTQMLTPIYVPHSHSFTLDIRFHLIETLKLILYSSLLRRRTSCISHHQSF
jgi:hypothetical protein